MAPRALMSTLLLLYACSGESGSDGQRTFESYFDALPVFWSEIYGAGGSTLYCAQTFGKRKGREINIEHVYPMSWVMKAEHCGDRDRCRDTRPRFNRIEADMHNLYPSRKNINKARGSLPFGEVSGENRRYGKCDFEVDYRRRLIEPRPASRGNIARAMFYMHDTYGLKIFNKQGRMLKKWHQADPPDREERRRNDLIAKIQGTRNRFVDQPNLADSLHF